MTVEVTVVGAGVVGLAVAAELARAGHDVTVVAERTLDDTTSAVAGAIWFPYRAGPADAVARWARRTRDRLEAIAAAHPEAGVDVLVALELEPDAPADAPPPWWLPAAPDAAQVVTDLPGAPRAWRFRAPRVEPARLLPWLAAALPRPILRRRVDRLADLPGDVVVNCAGLGARRLCGDATIVALAGQVVVCEPGDVDLGVTISEERADGTIFYAIPRRDEVVLGGCAIEVAGDEPPPEDPALTARILADAARLGLRPGPFRRVRRGLRPYRPAVRLDRDPTDPRVVHCYGHGGAGYTLCFGCAEDVAAIVAG